MLRIEVLKRGLTPELNILNELYVDAKMLEEALCFAMTLVQGTCTKRQLSEDGTWEIGKQNHLPDCP
jgi:hypothetical protein